MTRQHSRSRGLLALAGVLGLVVGLTACDPKEAGSAAVVGGFRITESQVANDVDEVNAALGGAQTQTPEALLQATTNRRILEHLFDVAAEREDIQVTQGEIDSLITQAEQGGTRADLEKSLAQNGVPPSELEAEVRAFIIQQKLLSLVAPGKSAADQATALSAYMTNLGNEVGVSVNPRYGSWDAAKGAVEPPLDDLSQPANPAPAASATPSAG